VPSRPGGEVWAGARDIFAKRETLAASGAEVRKHGAEDAPASLEDAFAYLAEQGAAMPGLVFQAAALAFRRAARRQMSTHRQISSHHPTSARAFLFFDPSPWSLRESYHATSARRACAVFNNYRLCSEKLHGMVVLAFDRCHSTAVARWPRTTEYRNRRRVR
jgi:hypothetical protein